MRLWYNGCIMSEEIETFDQERADRIIWRHIGRKPVSEIAKLVSMKPEEVLRRKNELIESVDVLTIHEKRTKLLSELEEIAANAKDRYTNASDEFAAGLLNSSVAAIKTVLGELNRMEAKSSGEVEKLNNLRIKELLSLVDRVVHTSVRELAEKYDLDESDMLEVFQENLVSAAREIDEE